MLNLGKGYFRSHKPERGVPTTAMSRKIHHVVPCSNLSITGSSKVQQFLFFLAVPEKDTTV